jgi:hypothetical protein
MCIVPSTARHFDKKVRTWPTLLGIFKKVPEKRFGNLFIQETRKYLLWPGQKTISEPKTIFYTSHGLALMVG